MNDLSKGEKLAWIASFVIMITVGLWLFIYIEDFFVLMIGILDFLAYFYFRNRSN